MGHGASVNEREEGWLEKEDTKKVKTKAKYKIIKLIMVNYTLKTSQIRIVSNWEFQQVSMVSRSEWIIEVTVIQ